MTTSQMATRGRIRVVVRTRPSPSFAGHLIKFPTDGKTVIVHHRIVSNKDKYINNQPPEWSFTVDNVLHNSSQEDVYRISAEETVRRALDGFNGTVMAYGQTGAGKTFTMTGHTENYRLRGVIPRAVSQVFQEIRNRPDTAVCVRISYVEIYNETMYDLLSTFPEKGESPPPLTVVENDKGGVSVKGLSARPVHNEEEALNLLFEGETNRAIGAHSLNMTSSRSHCVFTVYVESRSRVESGAAYTVSKLNLVDLAGSERLGKTNSEGQTQKEAMYINKSLTFLEQVVIALADKKRDHVPYRQSKLTHMLKDSLGGGCHTVLIANIWGDADQLEETTSTLRFATRMMCISSEPVQNILQDPLLLLKQYEQEIKSLRQELAMHNTLANRSNVSYEPLSENEIQDIQREVRRYLDGTVQDIELLSVRQIKETFSQFRRVVLDMQEEFSEGGKSLVVPSQAHLSTSQPVERKHSRTSKTGKQSTAESLVSEDVLVGDTDGQGFSLGIAPALSRGVLSPVVATKKMKNKGKLTDNEVEDRFDVAKETDPIPVAGEKEELEYLDTPPSREEAFEQFKKERGKEVNRVLMENKDILRSKRKEAHDLSLLLNKTKQSIDEVKQRLDQRKDMTGHLATSDGVEVMDESHFADLAELKKCKLEYRSQQANLDQLKLEISHCQQFVERSRQKLVQEFDHWYQVSFLGEGVEVDTDLQVKMAESDGELFDRLQKEFLKNGTDEVRFYNAKTRTDMRTTHPRRRPGNVTSSLLNKPPTLLSLS